MNPAPPPRFPSRAFLVVLYVASLGIFVIGLHSFLFSRHQVVLTSVASQAYAFMSRLVGWTLYGFLPLATILFFFTFLRIMAGPLSDRAKHVCALLEVVAYALGIMGPISHQIFKSGGATVAGEGFGSLALGILCWVWSVVICFDFQHLKLVPQISPVSQP